MKVITASTGGIASAARELTLHMGCAPTPRGHEVCVLSTFVDHYNRVHATRFAFDRVLDASGSTPQPEALYVDPVTQRKLVIEHKTLVWPSEHFKLHRSCHDVAGNIERIIEPVLSPDRAYLLRLPDDLRGPLRDLHTFAEGVGVSIREGINAVHEGKILRSRHPGREWLFREDPPYEREYFEPSKGLIVEFTGGWTALPPSDITAEIATVLADILARASAKFQSYQDARRLLVLDPHGDARFTPDEQWAQIFLMVSIPAEIDEVWLSFHDRVTDTVCGWMYRELWPEFTEEHVSACTNRYVGESTVEVNKFSDAPVP